jgi:hypothetical protein
VAEKIVAVGSTPGGGTADLLGKLNADESSAPWAR